MNASELIQYFGALKDSEILDEMKEEILRMRDQEDCGIAKSEERTHISNTIGDVVTR